MDGKDIGELNAVNENFIVVRRGFINVHHYYIPIHKIKGWDRDVLLLKITETEVKSKYEKDVLPDPSRYRVKDYPYYDATNYPELLIVQPLHKKFIFIAPPNPDMSPVYKCDLCNGTMLSGEELSKHISSQH